KRGQKSFRKKMCISLHPPINSSCNSSFVDKFIFVEVDIYSGYHLYTLRNASFDDIDYKDYEFPNEIWIRKPDWEVGLKGAAFLAVVLLGVVGNALLLSIVLRNRSIHTPTNLLIANMAAADLATLLILPWIFFCIDCFQNYVLGEVGCRAQGFAECALLLTGVINLVAVSYDRLTAIVTPLEARLTIHGTHIVMATTWVTGALLGLPLIFLRIYRISNPQQFKMYCTEETVVMPIYWYVVIVFVVWLPLAVMTICYTGLFIKIQDAYSAMWFVSHYLITVNAALNPVIYGLTNETFRRAFRTTMIAKFLFGASATVSLPRMPRKPVQRQESKHLGLQNPDLNHWFVVPKQKKTITTDCYI
ncbi:hypothetical protein L9F63_004829, partial [Diploptera punctata]